MLRFATAYDCASAFFRQLYTKKHELDEMKGKMRGAKSQYDDEMRRKQHEIIELETSMSTLQVALALPEPRTQSSPLSPLSLMTKHQPM